MREWLQWGDCKSVVEWQLVEGLLGPVGGVENGESPGSVARGGDQIRPERWAGRQRWQGERAGLCDRRGN